MFTNNMRAMTPSYASPNVIQNAPKINYFLEDVFSLGITFLQMACLLDDSRLNCYCLNREAQHYHMVSKYINMSEQEYKNLDAEQAQEARLEKALELCEKFKNLPYFLKAVLKQMLKWEAQERPNFIKLMKLFADESNQLMDNLDNKDYVDDLI